MNRMVSLLACLAIISSGVQAGELFRWVDAKGVVHYSDTPPAKTDKDKVERKTLSSDDSQNEDLPYETRVAQQKFPVILYVGMGCGEVCTQARALLSKRGVPFSEKLLKTKQEIEAFAKLAGSINSPALKVGSNYLSGFSESGWNSELDVAGYPKTASYRQRVAPPKPPAPAVKPADNKPAGGQLGEVQSAEGQTAPAEPAAQ